MVVKLTDRAESRPTLEVEGRKWVRPGVVWQ